VFEGLVENCERTTINQEATVDSTQAILGGGVLFIILFFGIQYRFAQRERMKKSKEILDRYNPERNKRPLGI
jgi:hypothetical protein